MRSFARAAAESLSRSTVSALEFSRWNDPSPLMIKVLAFPPRPPLRVTASRVSSAPGGEALGAGAGAEVLGAGCGAGPVLPVPWLWPAL